MTDGASIVHASLHQRDAPIDVRERLTRDLPSGGADLFILATCHRVELSSILAPAESARASLETRLGTRLPAEAVVRTGRDAVLHLMRAACGLDSVVRGEAQVLRQLRRAFDASRAAQTLEPQLALVLRRSLELGRELRRTTALGTVRRSLGSLAVEVALDGLPADATVLVLGAGEVGKLAIRSLARRAGPVVVANRDVARAEAIARPHGATAIPLERIAEALAAADVVIAAADTRGAVLTADRLRTRLDRGPLTVVDLAVPRSVGPEARGLDGLRYVDVDGLSDRAGTELGPEALADIERRCAVAADAVMRELEERRAGPTIRALCERTEAIRRRQLERALARLAHLSLRDRRVVESLSERLAHALMHEPTVRLRSSPERDSAARDLFAL